MKRSHHEHRLTLVAHDKVELAEQLEAFLRGEEVLNSAKGRAVGEIARPVFVCSGMGQQWWAMGRELLAQEPVYRRALEEVNEIYIKLAGWSLIDKLSADENSSEVQRTHVAQPAIFATQVGLHALWKSWGIEPAAVFGHSAGEVAASYIAGALSLGDAVKVIFHRSRLLNRTIGQGSMLAAGIPREEAARLVALHPRDISIAAINAANSVTLSGDAAILADIDKKLNEAGIFSRALQVEAPFHSQKMEQIETELVESLRDIKPQVATVPFFSSVTGTALIGTEVDGEHWYRNTRQPVLFSDVMAEVVKLGHRLFLEIGAHPVLRYDIAACFKENSVQGTSLASIRRADRERAAMLGSLGRMHVLGRDIDWQKLYPADAQAIKLPLYKFQLETYWREQELTRRNRMGLSIHPLLGNRQEAPQPSWQGVIEVASQSYVADHLIGGAIVFPGAGFVEMALAAARETFGPVPCVLEDIEFQKLLIIDSNAGVPAQVVIDPASSDFSVYAQPDSRDNTWDLHARGNMRVNNLPPPAASDLSQIRQRCGEFVDRGEHYRIFSEMGVEYGPTFKAITGLWRGDREALAEITAPDGVHGEINDYRLHPALLDACLHSAMAALPPEQTTAQAAKGELYLPIKIERVRVHRALPPRFIAHTEVNSFSLREMNVDITLLDDRGNVIAEVLGFISRPTGRRMQPAENALYEYQWKLALDATTRGTRDSSHIASPQSLAPVMQEAGAALRQRLDRTRFQDEFLPLSRATAASYIAHALRELGWTPALDASMPIEQLAEKLKVAPQYHNWLRLIMKELSADELASAGEPSGVWKNTWNTIPECQAEALLTRLCGENLPAVLRGELDPLSLIFPEGDVTTPEHLYRDSPTFRISNLVIQKAIVEIVQRLPKGKALRVLEIGGGTGGMTSFVAPVLPEYCTDYVFTDVSPRFVGHNQAALAQYGFMRFETLDIEQNPLDQGFDPHSFDLIIASDVLHATQDLRQTLTHIKQLLGSNGTLMFLELTRPGLGATAVFGLLKGWWSFRDHDLRPDEPCLSLEKWQDLLRAEGFSESLCIADCPQEELAQHVVFLAQGPKIATSPMFTLEKLGEQKTWLLFSDREATTAPAASASLARELRQRGDSVVEVYSGTGFGRDGSAYTIRAGEPDDMQALLRSVAKDTPRLTGIVHLWSLDIPTSESMTNEMLRSSARLGTVGALHLVQALAATEGIETAGVWFVTRNAQVLDNRDAPVELAQAPLWSFVRVAATEHQNLHCKLVDLTSGSPEEIRTLADQLSAADDAEDEIALHGELRYVNRLVPITPDTAHGMGRQTGSASLPFRIELERPGVLYSLAAHRLTRTPPGPHEIEIEVVATGINYRDLMQATGRMLPEAMTKESAGGRFLGMECAGRVVAVGSQVADFVVGDEVLAGAECSLATHVNVDARFAGRKPPELTFEQAATMPVAYVTAWYSLHTLGQLQPGERVLIHSAAGGVGLAAVNLALQAGAEVFATAGSPEKRDLLMALGVRHVMDSRTLAFADQVMEITGGEGVDLVLNSLSGEAIDKSLSVVRSCGRFIEIGLSDFFKNRRVGTKALRKNVSLFAVDLTTAFEMRPMLHRAVLNEVFSRLGQTGVTPLPHRVFPVGRIADAFRQMAEAKNIGKLVISMKDAEGLRVKETPQPVAVRAEGTYLITGGLGGFGLAVANRLAQRGARHLALVGRSQPSEAAQAAVDSLRKRGVDVMVCQGDIADGEQTRRLIADIQRAQGPLRGVMHAAMVLDDASVERLTEERMWKAMAPKVLGAWNLHRLTADIPLDLFALFSSITSAIGNPGQGNYAAGCGFLDSLAYYRRARELPALAVNWGMVGEVGHVASSPETTERLTRLGMTPLPLSETLDTLDELMSSRVVQAVAAQLEWKEYLRLSGSRIPPKFSRLIGDVGIEEGGAATGSRVRDILDADAAALPGLLENYIREHLARAMGASPSRLDTQQSLLNLGIDSLIAVEVRNRINEDLGVNISLAKFMQSASISALAASIAERMLEGDRGAGTPQVAAPLIAPAGEPSAGPDAVSPAKISGAVATPSVERATRPSQPAVSVVPIQPNGTKPPLFCIYPSGGGTLVYRTLARHLGTDQPVYGIEEARFDARTDSLDSIEEMARHCGEAVLATRSSGPYLLAGWSLGGQIAFEMAQQLTARGADVALVTLIDAFPLLPEVTIHLERWLERERSASNIFDKADFSHVEPIMRRHFQASIRHKAAPYPGKMLLLYASDHDELEACRDLGYWEARVPDGLEVEAVAANHFSLMQEPAIGIVARRLAESLERAGRKVPEAV